MKVKIKHASEPEVATDHITHIPYTTRMTGESCSTTDENNKSIMPEANNEPANTATVREARDKLCIKTKLARSRLLILIACLAYIITVLVTLSVGLQGISSVLTLRLENARIELRAQSNLRYREQMLYTQLDKMLHTQLRRGFMETYDECLARGLQEANNNFFGLGFRYPDIREKSMEWSAENCGRLMFAPQILKSTRQQAVMTHWARTTYNARRVVEKTLVIISSAWGWYRNAFESHSSKTTVNPLETEELTWKSPAVRPKMPFGFALNCEGSSPCQLTYPKTTGDKATISADEINESVLKVDKLSRVCARFNSLQNFTDLLALFYIPLEILFLVAYSTAGICLLNLLPSIEAKDKKSRFGVCGDTYRLSNAERYAVGSISLQLFMMVVRVLWERFRPEANNGALITGIFVTGLGVSMLINMLIPGKQLENVFQISESIRELYFILTSREKDPETAAAPVKSSEKTSKRLTITEVQELLSRRLRQASTIRRKSIPLATTVQEDIKADMGVLRHEHTYDASVESDSDSDFGGEPFVDLAGGITPTTEEVESDIVVVDA